MLILHETYDHWSVAVLTVTVHSSFFPTFDFFKKYVTFCTGFNLLIPIFMLPYFIMDLPIFGPDCMTHWIMEKLQGFTDVGLLRISESVRAYAYLILSSQASVRSNIIGNIAGTLTT